MITGTLWRRKIGCGDLPTAAPDPVQWAVPASDTAIADAPPRKGERPNSDSAISASEIRWGRAIICEQSNV